MSAGRELFEKTTGRLDQFESLSNVTRQSWEQRAVGDLSFIPSEKHDDNRVVELIVAPRPDPEVPAMLVDLDHPEMPGGAKTIVRKAEKNGWKVLLSYCRGPWTMQAETQENEEGVEETVKYGQADSVLIRGSRRVHGQLQRFSVLYLRRPWTKAGQKPATRAGAGGYQGEIRQVRPVPHGKESGIVNDKELAALIQSDTAWRTNS